MPAVVWLWPSDDDDGDGDDDGDDDDDDDECKTILTLVRAANGAGRAQLSVTTLPATASDRAGENTKQQIQNQ